MSRALALAACAALSLGAVTALRMGEGGQPFRETLYVFGTLVEIEIRGVSQNRAQAAANAMAADLNTWHRDWHAWKPGTLSALNAGFAAGQGGAVDPVLLAVLDQGAKLACLSDGMFEPAIGGLVGLWGFHADTPPTGVPPAEAEVAALRDAHPAMTALTVTDGAIASDNPAVLLDLGGYAKGLALDLAGDRLLALGIADAVLNAGGDVNVLGDHGARPWRVAIRDPFVWGAVASVEMATGEVLYTSGNYERYFDHEGERFAHILDPRSGRPVQDVVSVSVLGDNGALADAAATALSVAGADWPRIAGRMGVGAVLVITGDGRMEATPEMAARLNWLEADSAKALVLRDVTPPQTAPDCPGLARAG